ncbi:Transient receptor potential cation channel trpm, partial [Trichostrongylus colubriformis]
CGCGRLRSAHIDIPSLTISLLNHRGSDYVNKRRTETGSDQNATDDQNEVVQPRIRGRRTGKLGERWSLKKHTICLPTNAFGTIEFQGGPHPHKAQYVRLSFDTDPVLIMSMFEEVWQIAPPKLIITVHGGTNNFDLQPKLARVFRKGLLRAATTTGAWIITSGVDTGVVRHVAAAFEGASSTSRNKVVCIGISPWGLLKKRDELIGEVRWMTSSEFCNY